MKLDVINIRLQNQEISIPRYTKPEDVVKYFGAIQSQDYPAAKWALGLRCLNSNNEIEQAYNEGRILRTHILRPTWHFVTPQDIKWMLELTAPRIEKISNYYYRKSGIDDDLLKSSLTIIEKSLLEKELTREELVRILKDHKIHLDNLGYVYLIGHAELMQLICSGPLKGKKHTYTLLQKQCSNTKTFTHDEALVELTTRYFQSHGPATFADFVWWSGLTFTEIKKAVQMTDTLSHEVIDGKIYWYFNKKQTIDPRTSDVYLLPNYDEYLIGYTNRDLVFDSSHISKLDARANPLFQHTIIWKGKVVGTWKRTVSKKEVTISPTIFSSVDQEFRENLLKRINEYVKFLNL